MQGRILCAAIGLAFLTACGGGGGGATPPAPTTPPVANTPLSYYMPLAQGNSWTFSSGGRIVDMGSSTVVCSCPASGAKMEQIALYPPGSSTISGSFFFTKNTPSGGTQLTNYVGVENDAYTNNITIASTTQFPYGVPIMDDVPSVNEFWSDGLGDVSTITSVGGTLTLANGSQVNNIAVDQITGGSSPITWGFAKGVGFTSIGAGTQSTSLTSFSVNVTTSASTGRRAAAVTQFVAHSGVPDAASVVRSLLGSNQH